MISGSHSADDTLEVPTLDMDGSSRAHVWEEAQTYSTDVEEALGSLRSLTPTRSSAR